MLSYQGMMKTRKIGCTHLVQTKVLFNFCNAQLVEFTQEKAMEKELTIFFPLGKNY